MPQMAPMSWMLMYMYFIAMFIMFIMKIYFNKELFIKNNMNSYKELKFNWKW